MGRYAGESNGGTTYGLNGCTPPGYHPQLPQKNGTSPAWWLGASNKGSSALLKTPGETPKYGTTLVVPKFGFKMLIPQDLKAETSKSSKFQTQVGIPWCQICRQEFIECPIMLQQYLPRQWPEPLIIGWWPLWGGSGLAMWRHTLKPPKMRRALRNEQETSLFSSLCIDSSSENKRNESREKTYGSQIFLVKQ
jgi:hypothetical protein